MTLLTVLLCCLLPLQDGKKYESKDYQFKLAFPGKPTLTSLDATSDVGKLTFHMTIWDGEDKAVIVSKVDYPVDVKTFNAEQALDKGIVGAAKNAAGPAQDIKKTTFGPNKLPARTFVVEKVKDQIWGRNLLVMRGTRLYHVIVMGDKKYIHSKDADVIMASFEITK